MTLAEAKELFLTHCKFEKNLSPKTITAYDLDSRQFMDYLDKGILENVNLITKSEIRGYLKSMQSFEIKTIKRKVASIKALLNFLEYEDLIKVSPFRKLKLRLKEPKHLPVLMNQKEVEKLLQEAYTDYSNCSKENMSSLLILRDVVVLELLFATGMRVSELCNLKEEDFDLNTGSILIMGKGSKERMIQVCDPKILELIRRYRRKLEDSGQGTKAFFASRLNNPLSDQSVRYMIRKYYIKAGINKHITPHTFRHTFATLLLEEDVDIKYIQHFLGHSSISVTQIYTHVNQEKQRKILSSKHPRLKFDMTISYPE